VVPNSGVLRVPVRLCGGDKVRGKVRGKVFSVHFRVIPFAAHKADSPAGESPAMVNDDEPFSDNQLGHWGDPAQESLVVNVLAEQGKQ